MGASLPLCSRGLQGLSLKGLMRSSFKLTSQDSRCDFAVLLLSCCAI